MTDTPALSALLDQYAEAVRKCARWSPRWSDDEGARVIAARDAARQRVEEAVRQQFAELQEAAQCADWQQVVLNGGPPCFHVEDKRFCLRAQRWQGHNVMHDFTTLDVALGGGVRSPKEGD